MMLSSLKKEESSEKCVDQPQATDEENLKLAEHLKKTLVYFEDKLIHFSSRIPVQAGFSIHSLHRPDFSTGLTKSCSKGLEKPKVLVNKSKNSKVVVKNSSGARGKRSLAEAQHCVLHSCPKKVWR